MIYKKIFLSLAMLIGGIFFSASAADLSIYPLTSIWRDEHNKDVSLKEFQGKKVVMAMAYTSCKGSCPMIVGKLKKIENLFNEKKNPVEVVVITFDPLIDTPERHDAFYREKMGIKGMNWHFLTGTPSDTRKLSMLLGIKYAKNPRSGMIIHDNKIVLLNSEGEVEKRMEDLNEDEKIIVPEKEKMKDIEELIQKYNRPGPRYTSYPPVPFWNGPPSEKEWLSHVKENYQQDVGVDLYVHVPFCERLCYYCGCNRTITKNHEVEDHYLAVVLKEWELYKTKLGFTFKVNSLHFGGGTPTFLSGANLDRLMSALLENKSTSFIGSIEIDPRTCRDDHLQVLSRHGVKRASLGIQDFDPAVQKAINRDQSPEMVEIIVRKLRQYKMESINFDLIYGLPKQTLSSIDETIEIVNELAPDLIAFYSYAHLPDKIKNQRLINESDLPGPALKRDLYESGRELLLKKGYCDIGIDHFSRPSNFLYQAMKEKRLHRNFMGYVDKKSPLLIGLGPSSISDSSKSFIQNVKEMKEYAQKVDKGDLPFQVGHTHSDVDLRIQDIILQVMCHNEIKLPGKDEIPYGEEILKELMAFREDGIVEMMEDRVAITSRGRGFVRNVAMAFDYRLREQVNKVKFSQTI